MVTSRQSGYLKKCRPFLVQKRRKKFEFTSEIIVQRPSLTPLLFLRFSTAKMTDFSLELTQDLVNRLTQRNPSNTFRTFAWKCEKVACAIAH